MDDTKLSKLEMVAYMVGLIACALLFMWADGVFAATQPQYVYSLYKGTSKLKDMPPQTTEAAANLACEQEVAAQQKLTTSKVMCKTLAISVITVPDPPPPSTATLTWQLVTQNTNGTPYTDPFGYVIDYGNAPDQLTQSIDVNDPKATSYVMPVLQPGTWYFCIHARNMSNVRSDCSPTVSKTL